MGEEQNKSDEEDRFEESLRQILSNAPPSGGQGTARKPPAPAARTESGAREPAAAKGGAESKALFWLGLMRPLAFLALVALLAMFVLRITAAR